MCLALKRNSASLVTSVFGNDIKISPSGDYILYKENPSSVSLFDLDTKENTKFANQAVNFTDPLFIKHYGFSKDGFLAWSIDPDENILKVRDLIKKTTQTTNLPYDEDIVVESKLSKDHSQLINITVPIEDFEKGEELQEELKDLPRQTAEKMKIEFFKQMNININLLDMNNLNQNLVYRATFYDLMFQCSVVTSDMTSAVIHENGSLYTKSLIDSDQEPLEIFGPVEGINTVSLTRELVFRSSPANCLFLDENTALIQDEKKEQWIVRRIKEREQFIVKGGEFLNVSIPQFSEGEFLNASILQFSKMIYYPFLVFSDQRGSWVYHFPTGQIQILPEYYIKIGKGGQFAIELVNSEEVSYIQAVHQPFDSSKKQVLLKMPHEEVNHISLNEDKNLAFIGTVLGDLFVLNGETGHIRRHFFGALFRNVKVSDSGNTFLLEDKDRISSDRKYYKIHQIQEKCVEPVSSFTGDLESQLQQWTHQGNPTDDKLLAVLTGILQKEELTKKYSKPIQALLWKIFLHFPLLYSELHLRYPSLQSLPPFPISLIEDEKTGVQARTALISLLDSQSQFLHTRLFHWNFISKLGLLFSLLEDQEKDFYIEKITISLSNGATKSEALFQDVFQSKIFYVIYSHVKSWFGKDYEPVSDITVVRKSKGFQTVILSSEPIQNQASIETDFGIHYATVEDFSQELSVTETKPGQEIVNDLIEWSLLNGPSYRAQLQIHVQDNYIEPSLPVKKEGPDYESIWQDQKMTGLVVIGSSLRSFSKTLLENYLAYFENQGFQFSSLSVPDFELFLKEKIGGCELDYFLKESHSDGDERNVFRFDRRNSVLKGVRQIEEGRAEVIYLAFPKPFHFGDRETLLFSNLELAELIKQREKKACGEITYFNTSCWAHVKARYEIESVNNSSLFLNIPSKSLSDTFLNQEGDAIRELLSAYRNQLDFNGFRESLKKNEGYLSGKLNQYIFPDERRYYNSIFQHIKIPLKIQIDLERKKTEEWVILNPDEAL